MGNLVQKVEFLDRDGVDFVKHVDAWHVNAVALDDIDQIVHGAVLLEGDVAVVDAVLLKN